MPKYIARNYSEGRVMKSVEFDAAHDQEAIKIAEKAMPEAHGSRGSAPESGVKSRVIGIKCVEA